MQKPISHLTHRAITDHLAIMRNSVHDIATEIAALRSNDRQLRKRDYETAKVALNRFLNNAQLMADCRRETCSDGK